MFGAYECQCRAGHVAVDLMLLASEVGRNNVLYTTVLWPRSVCFESKLQFGVFDLGTVDLLRCIGVVT